VGMLDWEKMSMCQQWLSVAGYILEICGFLLIAREWYHVFKLDELQRRNRIHEDYERTSAEYSGREYQDPSRADHTMWREFQRLLNRDIRYRRRLFFAGAFLVISGALLQLLGSWPGGVFGIKSC